MEIALFRLLSFILLFIGLSMFIYIDKELYIKHKIKRLTKNS
jgi:hypothetical protein